ncbi:MarR family winged helix-turn-helix transcriptional regulator [Terribacillus saccharophilus]|uniref:MarR family transcriptional regulator n=1 Tax=Terribacillus saccharophilus TaxID=361277 RepID=A0ABX4H3Y2_9BACI|nr:MarR family transcriptional regulator [Terribacillus saccharophilus]PAD34145.1 MarR family transcriptional regulator [Terribacillus saccharophilus]PAD98029.1 MarR family transcriptional regulator [Terribacillus saccharophilus]PAE01805.1 MarR family transcriptional regulator [Terribacillus saccharophilus]
MNTNHDFMDEWLSLDNLQLKIKKELETVLQKEYNLSIKEFYVLYYLSKAPEKKLRLQQLQELIGLSQSALSRLVANMEASSCGALQKHVCTDDRRGTYTQMTELGENKLQGGLQTFQEVISTNFAQVDSEHILKQLLEKL